MFEAPDVGADGNSEGRPTGMMRDRNCDGDGVERGVWGRPERKKILEYRFFE